MTMTAEQAKAILGDLFTKTPKASAPKKVAGAPTKDTGIPAKPIKFRTTLALTSAGYLPALRMITIKHQHCTCCNHDSEYVLPAVIRFENKKNAAIEIPASIMENLPTTVNETWETVSQCAVCIRMSRKIDDLICLFPEPTQMELFS